MIKYYNTMVVFSEIPDEITLAINITNCPCHCPSCHSKFLWDDVGTVLNIEEVDRLIKLNEGITCVCFMGGDATPSEVNELAHYVSTNFKNVKVAWYSGRDEISTEITPTYFDYIKIGRYDDRFGGLNKRTTNQKLFDIKNGFKNITQKFWKHDETV